MIHEEICTYEVCKLAKEKGFPLQKVIKQNGRAFFYELPQSHPDWANCDAWYLPTQSLLQRWLREEKSIQIVIRPKLDNLGAWIWGYYRWTIFIFNECRPMRYSIYNGDNSTYELALEDALKYALENLV